MIALLDKVFALEIPEARRGKRVYEAFLANTEELRKFINSHQYIQGFQISTAEFYQGDRKVLANLEEYVKLLQEKKDVEGFRRASEQGDAGENSKNVEILEGRSSLKKITCDFSKFNEEDLLLVEEEQPVEGLAEQEKPV